MSGTIALVHAADLTGKELREGLESRMTSWREVLLLSADPEEVGILTEVGGAATFVQRYEPETLRKASTVFFCGPAERNRPLYGDLAPGTTAVVLSPDATLEDGRPVVAGVNSELAETVGSRERLVSPHPAVVLLAHLLHPLRAFHPSDAVATVIQPASAQGTPGIEELFEQTRQIVAMTKRDPMPVYGAQLSFNLLPTALESLSLSELLLAVLPESPPVALQVLQGGIFHGLSASLHVRLSGNPSPQAVRKALAGNPQVEIAAKPRHLGPIDSGQSDKVVVGAVRTDPVGGYWLWAVVDNLTRGTALNAIEIAEAAG